MVESIGSYDDFDDYTLISRESLKLLDEMHIEWRGRNISEIYDDVRIRAIMMAAQEYSRNSHEKPPNELDRIKSETTEFITDVFSTVEADPDQEESDLASRFDPISGAYIVLPGTTCSPWKKIADQQKTIARNLDHALQARGFKSYRLSDAFS